MKYINKKKKYEKLKSASVWQLSYFVEITEFREGITGLSLLSTAGTKERAKAPLGWLAYTSYSKRTLTSKYFKESMHWHAFAAISGDIFLPGLVTEILRCNLRSLSARAPP